MVDFTCGFADVASGKAIAHDTIFRIYSMTKPVTAALALILAEKGVISLDDDVSKYLPCFAQAKLRVLTGPHLPLSSALASLRHTNLVRALLALSSTLFYLRRGR